MDQLPDSSTTIPSAFRQSLPVTLTSFVNKVGDIGLRVFPMLLVEVQASHDQSSLVMGFVKGAAIFSTLAGGWLSDRVGSKRVILLSFVCSALGMFALMGKTNLVVICLAGVWVSFGQGLFAAPLRLLLFETSEPGKRQEALAWLRAGNNAAIMTANAVAYCASGLGLIGLFLFDAVTSLLAVFIGMKWLPSPTKHSEKQESAKPIAEPQRQGSKRVFALVTLAVATFTMIAEIFFIASAALAKRQLGDDGVALFAQIYMINTGLCMLGAVVVSRLLRNPWVSMPLGFLIQLVGVIFLLTNHNTAADFYIAVLLQSLGEVIHSSTAQYTLMRTMPGGSKPGTTYSTAMLMQQVGKMLAGLLAFQLIR